VRDAGAITGATSLAQARCAMPGPDCIVLCQVEEKRRDYGASNMSLSSLNANTAMAYDGQLYRRERRSAHDVSGDAEARGDARPGERDGNSRSGNPLDAAYYANRFKANLSDFEIFAEERADLPDTIRPSPDWSDGGGALFDFVGNFSVLLVSVRSGDLERARAAADALQMEVMVVRSTTGLSGEARLPAMLGDLGRLLSAARSGDERAARPPAKDLPHDLQSPLDAPPPQGGEAAGAAYDTLMAYGDDELDSAA